MCTPGHLTLTHKSENRPGESAVPVLPTFGTAPATATTATVAHCAPTAAAAAALAGGRGGQALQLAFALRDSQCRHGLGPLHLPSQVLQPFSGARGQLCE